MKAFDSDAWIKETLRLRGPSPLPLHLYKFLSLDKTKAPFGLLNLEDILLNQKIFLSSPRNFNDISDCRVQLDFSGSSEDYMKMQKDIYARHEGIKPKEAKKKVRKINLTRKRINDILRASVHKNADRYGIACFTEHISSPTQWAHYANNHKGVAIEFRWDGFSEDFPVFPIRYADQLPKVNVIKGDYGSIYLEGCYTKSLDWSYEKEWRIVKLEADNSYLNIRQGRVTAVILGANCDAATEQLLHDFQKQLSLSNKEPFQIKKARLSDTSYNIICDIEHGQQRN